MTTRGGAEGYLFTGIRVIPAEGRVEARGKFSRKKDVGAKVDIGSGTGDKVDNGASPDAVLKAEDAAAGKTVQQTQDTPMEES